jgi:hypothetical protein
MIRGITAGVLALAVATALMFAGADRWLPAEAHGPGADMAGSWTGEAEIAVNWTTQRTLRVQLSIGSDRRVSGTIGDAVLRNGRLERNRTAIGRALHVRTDWIIRGELEGDVVKTERIRRDAVTLPLNWVNDHFEGSVHTSGSHFGGRDAMWLAALRLRLTRATR